MSLAALIGDLLPQAVAIAISPLPIIAVILMLLAPRAVSVAVAFLAGWLVAVAVVATVMALCSSLILDADAASSRPIIGTAKIVLGALLLFLAVRQIRRRNTSDTSAPPPWMNAIEHLAPMRAAGIGFLLAAVNPKNLLLGMTAGVTIGTSGTTLGAAVGATVVYVVIASLSVAAPVVAYVAFGPRARAKLDPTRAWLTAHSGAIVTTLFLISGVMTIGKGIGSF